MHIAAAAAGAATAACAAVRHKYLHAVFLCAIYRVHRVQVFTCAQILFADCTRTFVVSCVRMKFNSQSNWKWKKKEIRPLERIMFTPLRCIPLHKVDDEVIAVRWRIHRYIDLNGSFKTPDRYMDDQIVLYCIVFFSLHEYEHRTVSS